MHKTEKLPSHPSGFCNTRPVIPSCNCTCVRMTKRIYRIVCCTLPSHTILIRVLMRLIR